MRWLPGAAASAAGKTRRSIRLKFGIAASVASTAVVASMLSATAAAAAATYVVDNTVALCSDLGQGNQAQPFCTIAAAAKKAQAGDTVLVAAGTYSGTSVNPANSGTAGSPITFTANGGVTISGGTRAFALSGRSNIVVNGFTVTGTSSYGISVSGGSGDVISRNTVSFAGQPVSGQNAAGIYVGSLAGGLVTGNIAHDNSAHGILLTGTTTGVTVSGNTSYHNAYQWERNANGIDDVAPGNSIIGNVTYANEDTGVNIYSGGDSALVAENISYGNGDHGIDDFNVTGGRIIGNTVYGNCTDGINVEGTSGNYLIENNVSMNNATGAIINPTPISPPGSYTNNCNRRVGNIGVYDSAPASTTANYNLVWQGGAGPEYTWAGTAYSSQQSLHAATGQEANGIFASPGFANAAAADFRLTAGSRAIDSADSGASGQQPADAAGNPRTDDPATTNTGAGARAYDDRGALEYQPAGADTGPTAHLSTGAAAYSAYEVTADASGSTAGTAPITSYRFNFGDGTTIGPQPDPTASHTYSSTGSFTVTVTVTDGNGLTSSTSRTFSIMQAPTARLAVSPSSGSAPLAVTADASASTPGSSPIASYTFNFGDGTTVGPQSSATAGHTYSAAGAYQVTVTVTDGNGLTATANQPVTVTGAGPARYVNQIATNSSTSAHTSGSVTVWRPAGVAAGDLIVVSVQLTGTATTGAATGTDSAGDTLTVASDVADGSGDRLLTLSGVARTGLAPNDQITVTFPSAATNRIAADEVAGAVTVDKQSAASGSGASFSSGATGTTSRAGEFVFAVTATFGGTSVSWGSGWTGLTTYATGSNALARAYQIPSGTGSFTGTGTASGTWLAEVIAFG
jgi:parallel beta-helix repeat protein